MKIIKIYDTPTGRTLLTELSENEAYLIERAMTAPIKRTVKKMSIDLQKIIDATIIAKNFNDKFIENFYNKRDKRKTSKKGVGK